MTEKTILQLLTFHIWRLSAELTLPENTEPKEVSLEHELNIDYAIGIKSDDEFRYRLSLMVELKPKEYGWSIEAKIDGYFKCPVDMTKPQRDGAVVINGGTILYGLLRGQLAAFTGSFSSGPYILPTVSMVEVVRRKQAQLAESEGADPSAAPAAEELPVNSIDN